MKKVEPRDRHNKYLKGSVLFPQADGSPEKDGGCSSHGHGEASAHAIYLQEDTSANGL